MTSEALADPKVVKNFARQDFSIFPENEQTISAANTLPHAEVEHWSQVVHENKMRRRNNQKIRRAGGCGWTRRDISKRSRATKLMSATRLIVLHLLKFERTSVYVVQGQKAVMPLSLSRVIDVA